MSRQLVECVPNFSEGRDAAKIDAIVESIVAVPEVALLDRESDADHNRSRADVCGPARCGRRSGSPRGGEGRGADRSHQAQRRASAHRRGGRGAVHPHRRRHAGGLREARRAGWLRNLEPARNPRLLLRSRGATARARQPGKHPARTVRGAAGGDGNRAGARARYRRSGLPSHRRRHGRGRAQVPDRLQHQPGHAGLEPSPSGSPRPFAFRPAVSAS